MKDWDPFRDLLTIQDRMNKLFETVLSGPVPAGSEGEGVHYWRPAAEVVETPDSFEIDCDLAGLDREDVDIRVDDQWLVIQGTRSRPEDQEDWEFHRLERLHGKFLRKFELPGGLDLDAVTARLEDGVLLVRLPKRPESRARAVPVARSSKRDN